MRKIFVLTPIFLATDEKQKALNRFKAGLFGHRRKLGGGGQAYPRSLNATIFVNTRAKVSKKITISQEFYQLFAKA